MKRFILGLLVCCVLLGTTTAKVFAKDCDCNMVDYSLFWTDPNNNDGNRHVIVWFNCNKDNDNPIVKAGLFFPTKKNWIVRDEGTNHPSVLVDGYYFWSRYLGGLKYGITARNVINSVYLE